MRPLIIIAILFSFAPSAQAVELVNPDGSRAEPFQTWADAARVPTPDATIIVLYDTSVCGDGVTGCAWADAIGLSPSCKAARSLRMRRACRAVFWHEQGHHIQRTFTHRELGRVELITGVPWGTTNPMVHGDHNGEIVADSYALCQFRRLSFSSYTTWGSATEQRRICKMLMEPR